MADPKKIIAATQQWLEKAVIGLNLCPFAKAVHVKQQIRYSVSDATTTSALRADLERELQLLQAADPQVLDTTLLIHPFVLEDFFAYNDFLAVVDRTVCALGLQDDIQIASFHPHYQFADSDANAIDNYTNRSPYPMLHLLREASVEKAVEAFPDAALIFERNIDTMRRLGRDGALELDVFGDESFGKTADDDASGI